MFALTAGGAGVDSKPVIKELLVSCFDGADNPEDAFLRDFLQGQHWRDDQPDGTRRLCIPLVQPLLLHRLHPPGEHPRHSSCQVSCWDRGPTNLAA